MSNQPPPHKSVALQSQQRPKQDQQKESPKHQQKSTQAIPNSSSSTELGIDLIFESPFGPTWLLPFIVPIFFFFFFLGAVFPVLGGRNLDEDEEELFDEDEDITEAYDHEELHADLDQLETEVEALQSHSLIPLRVQRRLERIDQKWGQKQEKWNRTIDRIRGRPNFDEATYQQRLKILAEHEAMPNSPFLQLLIAKKVLKDSKRKSSHVGADKGIECPQLSTRMHLFSEQTQQFLILFARHGLPSGWVVANYLEKQGMMTADLELQSPEVVLSNEPPSYQSALLQMQLEELRGLTHLPVGLKLKVLKKLNSKRGWSRG